MTDPSDISDPVAVEGAAFSARDIDVQDGVELRLYHWQPENPASETPIFFVAGWVSAIEGWVDMVRALVSRRPVYYLESREKRSARITRRRLTREDFTIQRMADDIVAACDRIGLDTSSVVFAGSSMGSTSILEALKHERLKARGAFVVGPNARFRFPWWGKALTRVPAGTYAVAIRIVLFYLRNFRVNSRMEPQQMQRYERTLLGAVPLRMKLSARAVYPYEIWDGLETIAVPVAVAHAPTDTLHGEDEIERIVEAIPKGRAVPCPSNLYMHSADVAHDIEELIASLQR
jgi:pimeloyl-ACP methyl ester carboxylesterase